MAVLFVFVSLDRLLKIINNMKKIFAILSISLMTVSANAQSEIVAANTNAPSKETLKVFIPTEEVLGLKETEFDFGKIPQGKPVTHVFEVVNNSKDTLRIQNIQASCGCTTPEWDKDKIPAPGEKTNIRVGYNAASEGPFTKQITVTYNGTQTKMIVIKGEVWKTPATSAPENKVLGSLND